jgi:NADH:ubiquinone reductase (H+-translocating)
LYTKACAYVTSKTKRRIILRVVIVGGGFGGIKTALQLSKDKRFHVTLVSDKDHFLYYPALYGTATGHSHLESVVTLERVFKDAPNVKLVTDTVTGIDRQQRTIIGKKGRYHYDNAVFALGVVTTYFGIEGLAENSFGIKSYEEVLRLKDHLHQELAKDHHMDKNYVVVGAGATGVELSAALTTYLDRIAQNHRVRHGKIRINLVEAAPRVLPRMSEAASKKVEKRLKTLGVNVQTNQKVEAASHEDITINGKKVPSHTVIWTSGVTNHPFFKEHEDIFPLAKNGRVEVDDHLRAAPHIYVIGDNAATPYTGLAQTALHDAHFIADHLQRVVHNKPLKRYKPQQPPVVVPAGENWAIFEWGWLRTGGFVASLVRRAADFIGYNDMLPIGQAIGTWRAQFVSEETCTECQQTVLNKKADETA